MDEIPLTDAETRALAATKHPAFPINLRDIRRNVALILSEFGRRGFYDEYTVHDFKHCIEMLKILDWIIPPATKQIMSDGDWLTIVLACYFHDIGLIITRDEFERREETEFRAFCDDKLFGGPNGADYRAKVALLPQDERERFLYQEFVRDRHAQRVRNWIEGKVGNSFGSTNNSIEAVQTLLAKLPFQYRRDLALICESHNLDDIHDIDKYKVSQPFGNSEAETVNLQYAAVLLRTVDLLQITQCRAPSVLFRLINPVDPISQREWIKQNAVTRIRPKIGIDRNGQADAKLQSDTIEVFALFTEETGFFGLTSYLAYARNEIRKSREAIENSTKVTAARYAFPWKYIDDDHIEAEGFLKQPFGFELDQAKILDLLTGHTLYNDSNVVVRELLQNALDAVRLQAHIERRPSEETGKIEVQWRSKDGTLEIIDNGTGMTQEVIEKHLLNVGSSRYHDPRFKEKHPEFSSISRFGIGVLSAFMVADSVEIITSASEEITARQISLRSVHGKYLIRLLDKNSEGDLRKISPHGTIVRLRFRSSVREIDILSSIRQWIVFPRCSVTAVIDDHPPNRIGYSSPREALEALLDSLDGRLLAKRSEFKVVERELDGVKLAFALQWSDIFCDWSLVNFDPRRRTEIDEEAFRSICTCIEGVAVEFRSPGFQHRNTLAIADATGLNAPKTNVARSSLEDTSERMDLNKKILTMYIHQIRAETDRLVQEEGYSKSWAACQIPYIAGPLFLHSTLDHSKILQEMLATLPMYAVEQVGSRTVMTLDELVACSQFYTISSKLFDSAERFVRDSPVELKVRDLVQAHALLAASIPEGIVVSNLDAGTHAIELAESRFDVTALHLFQMERRIDLQWKLKIDIPRWMPFHRIYTAIPQNLQPMGEQYHGRRMPNLAMPLSDVIKPVLMSSWAYTSMAAYTCYRISRWLNFWYL